MQYCFNRYSFWVSENEKRELSHGDAIIILKNNQSDIKKVMPALDVIVNNEINREHKCLNREDCWRLVKLLYKYINQEGTQ